ncbi:MAG: 50S ribosomal protein L35 [Candidatus Omnitrophica bacterium]|nr:50S ribosomal protein L35 [Candidatus Omnitrophota bacterium]
MPKLKTKKAFTKRLRVTKKGKILRSKEGRRHLLSCKSPGRKRGLGKKTLVSHADRRQIKDALPYAF